VKAGQPPPRVVLRRANAGDAARLLAWRNEADAIRFSVSRRPVSEAEHRAWFTQRLSDPKPRLWIAEVGGAPAGQIRSDVADGTATVSIVVAPSFRGQGLGRAILDALIDMAAGDAEIRDFKALADPENIASLRAFENSGFRRGPTLESGFLVLTRSAEPGTVADAAT
jgi:UDP-2,4-diacetamido-2,4,6-trideoxy-beta-L-altropyranose hydrolase